MRKQILPEEEQLAKRIVELVEPSLKLQHNSDQSSSIADFAIYQHDKEVGVLEVTRATNQNKEQIFNRLQSQSVLPREHCHNDWLIVINASKVIRHKEILKKADFYLHELEKCRITNFIYPMQRNIPYVAKIHDELNVDRGFHIDARTPSIALITGQIYKNSGGVNEAVEVEANKSDNLHKLDRPELLLRHIFVFVDVFRGPSYFNMLKAQTPQYPPSLPGIITHAWSVARQGHNLYVWRTDRTRWYNLTNLVRRSIMCTSTTIQES